MQPAVSAPPEYSADPKGLSAKTASAVEPAFAPPPPYAESDPERTREEDMPLRSVPEDEMVHRNVPFIVLFLYFLIGIAYLVIFPVAIVQSITLSYAARLVILCAQTGLGMLSGFLCMGVVCMRSRQKRQSLIEASGWLVATSGVSLAAVVLWALFEDISIEFVITGSLAAVLGFGQQLVFLSALGGWFPDGGMSLCMLKVVFFFVYFCIACYWKSPGSRAG